MIFLNTIDTHTAGEPTRIFTIGGTDPDGECESIAQRRDRFAEEHDSLRRLLIQEPRGHANMFGAVIAPPSKPEADLGVFFLHPDGYLDSCGHAIIGVVTALYNVGWFPKSRTIHLETPAGIVSAAPTVSNGDVESVTLRDIDSTVLKKTYEEIEGNDGNVSVAIDLVYAGNTFALVDIQTIEIDITTQHTHSLRKAALTIRETVNDAVALTNPFTENPIAVEIVMLYERRGDVVRTAAVFGDGSIDRSPCGTGTCALMALLHRHGDIDVGDELLFESLIDSCFIGRLSAADSGGGRTIANPTITGAAHITGFHTFVYASGDPIDGFTIN